MSFSRYILIVLVAALCTACDKRAPDGANSTSSPVAPRTPAATIADTFAYPIGKGAPVTQAKDGDDWFNALDLGENDHLGKDWNKNSGGNSDCGELVYAAANGTITYAGDAGPGWGNVLIIEHRLPSGDKIETLYGHHAVVLKNRGRGGQTRPDRQDRERERPLSVSSAF